MPGTAIFVADFIQYTLPPDPTVKCSVKLMFAGPLPISVIISDPTDTVIRTVVNVPPAPGDPQFPVIPLDPATPMVRIRTMLPPGAGPGLPAQAADPNYNHTWVARPDPSTSVIIVLTEDPTGGDTAKKHNHPTAKQAWDKATDANAEAKLAVELAAAANNTALMALFLALNTRVIK